MGASVHPLKRYLTIAGQMGRRASTLVALVKDMRGLVNRYFIVPCPSLDLPCVPAQQQVGHTFHTSTCNIWAGQAIAVHKRGLYDMAAGNCWWTNQVATFLEALVGRGRC